RSTKDFVDQHQIKMQSVGDMPTVVAGRLHRLDACKGWRIHGGASIGEAAMLPWPPTLRFRCRLCVVGRSSSAPPPTLLHVSVTVVRSPQPCRGLPVYHWPYSSTA